MSFRIDSSQPSRIQNDSQVSENQKQSSSETVSNIVDEITKQPASSETTASKFAEQSLSGLSRQLGLFKYALPGQNAVPELNGGQNTGATTMAVGEEDGGYKPDQPGTATTLAIGEEDGGLKPIDLQPKTPTPSGATTLAVGEEDGGYKPDQPGTATTLAIGEEDGGFSTSPAKTFTTMATGEEDGSK